VKNVIVLAVNKARYAVELRWVREVFTLGYITKVPQAPRTIAGVTNFRGSIMPVLDLGFVLDELGIAAAADRDGPAATQGDGAVILEVDDLFAAARVDNVAEVATLRPGDGGRLIDSRGGPVTLLSPPEILRWALATTQAEVEARKGRRGGPT